MESVSQKSLDRKITYSYVNPRFDTATYRSRIHHSDGSSDGPILPSTGAAPTVHAPMNDSVLATLVDLPQLSVPRKSTVYPYLLLPSIAENAA